MVFLPVNEGLGHLLGSLATLLAISMLVLNSPVILVAKGALTVRKARIKTSHISKIEVI